MSDISLTFDVSKSLMFNSFNSLQPANMQDIFVTFDVSKFLNSISDIL